MHVQCTLTFLSPAVFWWILLYVQLLCQPCCKGGVLEHFSWPHLPLSRSHISTFMQEELYNVKFRCEIPIQINNCQCKVQAATNDQYSEAGRQFGKNSTESTTNTTPAAWGRNSSSFGLRRECPGTSTMWTSFNFPFYNKKTKRVVCKVKFHSQIKEFSKSITNEKTDRPSTINKIHLSLLKV